MTSLQSIMLQLTSGFIYETDIPIEYLSIPEVLIAIKTNNWITKQSQTNGWITLIKIINFSN